MEEQYKHNPYTGKIDGPAVMRQHFRSTVRAGMRTGHGLEIVESLRQELAKMLEADAPAMDTVHAAAMSSLISSLETMKKFF